MTDKIEWGGTPGPWVFHDTGEGRHKIRMGEAVTSPYHYKSHLVWECDHCMEDDDDPDLNEQLLEAEKNARAMAEVPAMVEELRKFAAIPYAFQLHYQQQRVRAILARIDNQEGNN